MVILDLLGAIVFLVIVYVGADKVAKFLASKNDAPHDPHDPNLPPDHPNCRCISGENKEPS